MKCMQWILALAGKFTAVGALAEEMNLPTQTQIRERVRQQTREKTQYCERATVMTPEKQETRQAERGANRQGEQAMGGGMGRDRN